MIQCPVCGAWFARKKNMRIHRHRHRKVKRKSGGLLAGWGIRL